jgi:hypothetical protein
MPNETRISRPHFLKVMVYLGVVSLGGLEVSLNYIRKEDHSLLWFLLQDLQVLQLILQTAFAQRATDNAGNVGTNTVTITTS